MSAGAVPDAAEVSRRLERVASLTRLTPESRLDGMLDMSPDGVTRRLREAADLLTLCRRLDVTRSSG